MSEQEIKLLHNVQIETHLDGIWNTCRYKIEETIIVVKSRQGKGVKFHIMENDKVVKTFRFTTVNFKELEKVVTKYFNKWEIEKKKKEVQGQ